MEKVGIIRRFDDLGRISIPRDIRRMVFGERDVTGEPVEVFVDGNNIVLQCLSETEKERVIKKIPDLAEKWNATNKGKVPYEFVHWLKEQLKEE